MVIFLHGDDTYRSREKLRELKAKFLREVDPSGMNLVTIDGANVTTDEIWAAVAAQSFLVRKRMVVIEDLGAQKSNAAREGVTALLDRIPEDVIVVFWESGSRTAGRPSPTSSPPPGRGRKERGRGSKAASQRQDPFFPRLLKEKFAQEFTPLQGRELEAWVRARAKSLGVAIEPTAVRDLVSIVGPDLWCMANELEKLALATQKKPITSSLVRALVDAAPSGIPFAFLDAVGSGDRAAAIRLLRELESARVDPHHLLAMLHRQLRLLVMASDCLSRGIAPSRLAAELGVHPYVAQKIGQQARTASLSNLRCLYPKLLELDHRLKSSRAPWQALMDLFTLEATAR